MHFRYEASILPVLVLFSAFYLQPSGVQAQEKMTLGSSIASTQMPHRIAVEKGFLAAEGLEPDFKIVPGGSDIVPALVGGSMDFGESSHAIFLSAISNNLPIV